MRGYTFYHKYTVFLLACALPLLFAQQFAQGVARELDFWLLWLGAMILVGLPILFAEFALSARSQKQPWLGMQSLTREADASVIWRVFAGLSVLIAILVSANITTRVASGFEAHLPQVATELAVPSMGLSAGLMIVVLILSLLKHRLLPVGVLLIVAGSMISLFDGGIDSGVSVPVLTQVTLGEWGRAVLLALLSVGVGTGLYWADGLGLAMQAHQHKKSLAGLIFPVWLTQLIFGALAIFVGSAMVTPVSFAVVGVGMLLVAAYLLSHAAGELINRFGMIVGGVLLLVLAVLLSPLPPVVLLMALVVLSLVAVLVLSVFAGFVMKISHLRKTLNFASEARYNIWRILVRIIVPMALLMALAGWFVGWLM